MTSDKSHSLLHAALLLQCRSASCCMLHCCIADLYNEATFNIVAGIKLMTVTKESTYFAFQMIWEIVNLFLFHWVPGAAHQVEISAQPRSQDQPQPHFALAELLITGHQSGGGEAQPGPSSLHLQEQILPDGGLSGDAAKPHLLPSPGSHTQQKPGPRKSWA